MERFELKRYDPPTTKAQRHDINLSLFTGFRKGNFYEHGIQRPKVVKNGKTAPNR